jgi:hypothetical protein
MAINIAQYISDFLRDAQYRVAKLSVEIDNLRAEGDSDFNFILRRRKRDALIAFMELCYDPMTYFEANGYNFLKAVTAWSDREIAAEIEFLREYTDMTRVPYMTFSGYYPTILNNILGDGGGPSTPANLPDGDYLNILRYDANGNLQAVSFPEYVGALSLDINDYFAGRI